MPAIGNLTLADGQTTPVNHTFTAIYVDAAGVGHYEDQLGGIPIGFSRLSISLKRPNGSTAPGSSSKGTVYRARVKIDCPVLEVTSPSTGTGIQPAPTISHTGMFSADFVLPARSSEAERKDLRAFAKNLLANSVITDVVEKLLPIY